MTALFSAGELALTKLHGLGNDFLVVLDGGAAAGARPPGALAPRRQPVTRPPVTRPAGVSSPGRRLSGPAPL